MIRDGIRRLFRLGLHRPVDATRDVDEEVRLHLELRTEQLIAEGFTADAARVEAERRFAAGPEGRRTLDARAVQRESRMRSREWFESFTQDFRYVLRGLRRSPGFTVTVVATLALGLGANAALFSVLDRMFLQAPAGVRDPGNLHRAYWRSVNAQTGAPRMLSVYSYPMVRVMTEALPSGARLAGYGTSRRVPLGASADAVTGILGYVVGDYFGTVGVSIESGRPFAADEYRPEGLSPVVVLSHDLAVERFGSAAAAVGNPIDLATHLYTVVGVASAGFRGTDLDAVDAWVPLNTSHSWTKPSTWYTENGTLSIRVLVRASGDTAFAAVRTAAMAALRSFPFFSKSANGQLTFGSIREALSPEFDVNEQRIATRLGGVALIILLIACANVANILLARALSRRREIAVRLALGVNRARLVRQLLTESVVLAVIAAAGAVLVAVWGGSTLRATLLPDTQWGAPAVGWRVLVFVAASAIVAGFAAGLVPALQASRPRLSNALRGTARDGTSRHSGLRAGLLVAQVTLSLLLLVGAGLFIRSLREVRGIDIGYDTDQVLFGWIGRQGESPALPQIISSRLLEAAGRIERVRGVEQVAFSENIPMWGFSFDEHFLPGRDSLPIPPGSETVASFVSPRFYAAMGMRLLDGRDFTTDDRVGSEPVIAVNQAMADAYWPGERAVGKCLILHHRTDPCRRIIGLVSNAHFSGVIERHSLQFYVPLLQEGDDGKVGYAGALEIRTAAGRIAAVTDAVRRELEHSVPAGAHAGVRSFRDQIEPQFRTWRLGAQLFTLAGLLALLVAVVGIYGNVSYSLSQRTHEMGVRIALGAQAGDIVRMVLGEGLKVILIGVAAGIALAIAGGRLIASMLYGTTTHDPIVLGTVAVVLIVAAVAASLGPARRATRVDPIDSLRAE